MASLLGEGISGMASGIEVRFFNPGDADPLYDAVKAIGFERLGGKPNEWVEAFRSPHGHLWTGVFGGSVAGFAAAHSPQGGLALFHTDIVNPQHQRKGVGTALVLARLATLDGEEVERVGLIATEMSLPFYERFGFETDGEALEDPMCRLKLYRMEREYDDALGDEAFALLERAGVATPLGGTAG